jgi:hypothetical protein
LSYAREKFDTARIASKEFTHIQVGSGDRHDSATRESPIPLPAFFSVILFGKNKTKNNMAKTQNSKKQTKKAPLMSAKEKKLAKRAKKAR